MRLTGIAVIVAALATAGCQSRLCGESPFSAYAAPPAGPDPWMMAASPSIQLSSDVYSTPLTVCNFGRDWLAPYQPVYHSPAGTEMVRGFLTEPAFLTRSAIIDTKIDTGGDRDTIMDVGAEFAVTRRLQVNGTLPLNLSETDDVINYGSLGARTLLYDADGLIVSTNFDFDFDSRMVDFTPTANAWYDLANVGVPHWAVQTSIGAQILDGRDDQFLWTGGVSTSWAIGTTGRWDTILEAGYKDGDWQGSFGIVKPLDFISHDLDLRSGIIHDFDNGSWTVDVGFVFRF